jgi:hypothetical protein
MPLDYPTGHIITADEWNELAAYPPVVTAVPGTPEDKDEIILTDSLTAPTYYWHLRYNTTAAKWMFLGGTPLFHEVATAETTSSASYAALSTAGPSVTVPRAGTYDVEIGATMSHSQSAANVLMSYDIGATSALDDDAIRYSSQNNNASPSTHAESHQRTRRKSLATGNTLTAKYKTSGGASATIQGRYIRVTPVFLT